MTSLRRFLPLLLATAAGALLPAARATLGTSGWPQVPGDGLRAATLPVGETAADLSVAAGRSSDLFLAWTQSDGDLLRVQRLTDAGTPAYGASGTVVRSGTSLEIGPPSTRRANDARGRIDLFPTSDGGVLVAWAERAPVGRDVRVQRLDGSGTPLFAAGGVRVLETLQDGEDATGLALDGGNGLFAVGASGADGLGVLRFQHLRSDGSLAYSLPGFAVDASPDPKRGPAVERLGNGDAAVCWYRDDGNGLRLQVLGSTGARLAAGGVPLAPSGGGFPGLRAAGSSIPGYVLVAHRLSREVRLLLVDSSGTVLRDEMAGDADLLGPPEITAVNAVVSGLPEGIELKGIAPDGTARRFVRLMDGTWAPREVVAPPAAPGVDATGALGGPGWVFDLGDTDFGASTPRCIAYRSPATDGLLNPTLTPWLAASPGPAGVARVCDSAPWVFTAWVVPDGGTGGAVAAARSGAFGGPDVLDARGLLLRTLVVNRPAPPRTGKLNARAPEAFLPATYDPVEGKPAVPVSFSLRAGSERGTLATLSLLSFKGSKSLAWKARLSGAGGALQGLVRAGPAGRGLRIKIKGIPADFRERIGWIRVDIDDRSLAGTVVLQPNRSGKRAKFKRP